MEIKKNEDSNVQTNFIKIAADQPKLVYLEWMKIWVLSDGLKVEKAPADDIRVSEAGAFYIDAWCNGSIPVSKTVGESSNLSASGK